jgi:hypothetical protein
MIVKSIHGARWSTSSFGAPLAAPGDELSTLGEHLHACRDRGRRLFAVACGAEAMHRFVASKFVTTLVVAAVLLGLLMLAT